VSHEHSFATPGPAGLAALAVACFGFGAVFLGKVDISGYPLLAAWLIGGGVVQHTTAVMELKDRNITGGNVFLFFSAFFMYAAALSVLAKWYSVTSIFTPQALEMVADNPSLQVSAIVGEMLSKAVYIEGWLWMAGASFLTLVTPAYAKSTLLIFILVVLVDIVLWLIVGCDTGWFLIGGSLQLTKSIIGYLLVVSGFIGLYLAGATVCNTVYGRTIYYVPPPLIK